MRIAAVVVLFWSLGAAAQTGDDARLSFDRTVKATPYATEVTFSVFRGAKKERLEYADFYRLVGRVDLAERYTYWQRMRVVLGALAIGLSASGVLVAVWPFAVSCEGLRGQSAAFEQCRQSWARTTLPAHLITGASLIAVGQVLGGLARGINPQPVTYDVARELGEAYNQRLDLSVGAGGLSLSGSF